MIIIAITTITIIIIIIIIIISVPRVWKSQELKQKNNKKAVL